MTEENISEIQELFKQWWEHEDIDKEELKARVVLIYKKKTRINPKIQTNITTKYPIQNLRSNTTKKNFEQTRQTRTKDTIWIQKR
jgi:hypothetical protein